MTRPEHQIDPYDKTVFATVAQADTLHVHAAIRGALDKKKDWAAKTTADRVKIFLDAADAIDDVDDQAELLASIMYGQGKSLQEALLDIHEVRFVVSSFSWIVANP